MIEVALAADHGGHETVLCVADENHLGRPTTALVEAVCGEFPDEVEVALEGKESALSSAKAADLLGWTPAHSVRDGSGDVSAPRWL